MYTAKVAARLGDVFSSVQAFGLSLTTIRDEIDGRSRILRICLDWLLNQSRRGTGTHIGKELTFAKRQNTSLEV